MVLEVWAMDRRSELLEDRVGLEVAEQERDPFLALDFLFGEELGLELDPRLQEDPGRRLIAYNAGADLAFMANWTYLVHSLDIDAVVRRAADTARAGNVFLGGHSAGTHLRAVCCLRCGGQLGTHRDDDPGNPDPRKEDPRHRI